MSIKDNGRILELLNRQFQISLTSDICLLIRERQQVGYRRYQKGIDVHDGHKWLQEALEEVLDAIQYLVAHALQQNELTLGIKEAIEMQIDCAKKVIKLRSE